MLPDKWLLTNTLSVKNPFTEKHHQLHDKNPVNGNAQFIFLCIPQKLSVNVCRMKILQITITKK